MSKAMKQIAFILAITVACILLVLSLPASGQDQKTAEWTGKLRDGRTITKEDLSKILEEHEKWLRSVWKEGQEADLSGAKLRGARLRGANLKGINLRDSDLSEADLSGADLFMATLSGAKLIGANLRRTNLYGAALVETNLENADAIFADFTICRFEPENVDGFVFLGAKGLSTIWFVNFKGAAELRKIAKESGLRSEERALTAALRKYRLRAGLSHERIFEYFLLDLPTDSGANPWRSLATLVLLIPVFSIPYMIVLRKSGRDGIWQVWIPERVRKDLGEKKPVRLTLRGLAGVGVAIYFSVLSAFSIGWRELNVGNWITRLQRREYVLRPTGWVRTVSGLQSLISIYLLALWVLTYFGRPFE